MSRIYEEVVCPQDKRALHVFPSWIAETFYLAGGTALALQLGHRYSYDFDFFAPVDFDPERIEIDLEKIGRFIVFEKGKGTLELAWNETRISLLHYPYPVLEWGPKWENIRLASILDIGLMKLMAVASRGSRKDFVDLFFLSQLVALESLFFNLPRKYGRTSYNLYHIVKSLAYFEDARQEPMPSMIRLCDWQEVEEFFRKAQVCIAEKFF